MIKYFGFLFTFFAIQAFGQVKLYYTATGEISIQELATHYRVAHVDPLKKTFKGYVADFDTDGRLFLELNYDSDGIKNGKFKYNRFGFVLEGVFENNQPRISIPDSILALISKKEQFVPGVYIRKRDYPEIKNILSAPSPSTDSVIVNEEVYRIVEEAPSFPGGQPALSKFLGYYLHYPKEAKRNGITGKVFVEFTVSRDGTIDKIKVIRGIGSGCDESATYAISQLPDWKPGYQRGKAVAVTMVLPITFQ